MSFNSKYTGAQVEEILDNTKSYSANDILTKLQTIDGSGSGLNADLLDGFHISNASKPFGGIPFIGTTGYMDVGSNIDFHYDNTTGSDYSVRLKCTGNHTVTVSLPSSGGTLALTTDNVTSATKLQDDTAYTAWGQTFFANGKPQSLSGQLSNVGHINFATDGAYDIGSNTYSARYMYAKWVGAKSGNTFSIGANNGTHLYINTSGNVGIGKTNPAYKLTVAGTANFEGSTYIGTTSSALLGFMRGSANYITTPANGCLIFNMGGTTTSASYSCLELYEKDVIMVRVGGNVGIGTANPDYKLDVSGDIHTSGSVTQNSDINLKNISKDILISLDDISEAPLFEFTYKNDKNKRIHVGTSAQYWVEKNNWFCKKQDNGYYDMEIQNLALASAISIAKEFKKYKEETESTISSIKKEIEELKQLILNMNK